jgi:hypothetical protein
VKWSEESLRLKGIIKEQVKNEEDSKKTTAWQLMSIDESFLRLGMTVAIDFLSVLRVSQKEDVSLDL